MVEPFLCVGERVAEKDNAGDEDKVDHDINVTFKQVKFILHTLRLLLKKTQSVKVHTYHVS